MRGEVPEAVALRIATERPIVELRATHGGAMVIATFGPSTGWAGKAIDYDNGRFMLEGHGQISAGDVLTYDQQGHLEWAYGGLREWVETQAQAPAPAAVTVGPLMGTAVDRSGASPTAKKRRPLRIVLIAAAALIALIIVVAALNSGDSTEKATGPSAATGTTSQTADSSPPITSAVVPEGWQDSAVTVKLSADDPSATTYYTVDGSSKREGCRVLIRNPGVHSIVYWSVDEAGNCEEKTTDAVRIDKSGPRTLVLHSVTVTKGKRAKIDFVIRDLAPKVKAFIKLSGPSSRTFKLGTVTSGKKHTFRLPSGLAVGTYTVAVFAVDLAGNRQSKLGTNALVVEAKPPSSTGGGGGSGSVYLVGITETGECYHTLSCRYWTQDPEGNSKVTVSEAQALGFRPCSICDPPY